MIIKRLGHIDYFLTTPFSFDILIFELMYLKIVLPKIVLAIKPVCNSCISPNYRISRLGYANINFNKVIAVSVLSAPIDGQLYTNLNNQA